MNFYPRSQWSVRLLKLLAVLAGLSAASSALAINYDVEIIIFEHIRDTDVGSSDTLLLPVVRNALTIPMVQTQPTPAQALAQQPDSSIKALSSLRLVEQAEKIRGSNNHRLLYHGGWRQTDFDRENAPYMRIALGNRMPVYTEPGDADSVYLKSYLTPPLRSLVRYDENMTTTLSGGIKVWVGRFLHFETLLSYTPRGASFSFPMQTDRRMRSRQLHYLDNPRIGIITKIFPVDETAPN